MPRITPTLLSPALLPSGIPVVLLLALLGTCQLAPVSAGLPENTTARYIVVFHDDVEVDTVADELAGRFSLAVHFRYRHALRGMAVSMPPELLERLSADPRVAYIEPDVVMSAAAQALPTGIDRVNAELDPVAAIDNVDDRVNADIAILDTGIDLNHPDLNVFRFTNCVNTQSRCRDGDSNADDVFGHGTHVAGIAAALDNNSGVVGVAPGARLWAVKVLDDNGDGYESQIVAGVDYVTQYAGEIEVANMSLTGPGFSQALYDAISASVAAGVVYTLAAGNKGADVAGYFPAGHPEAITVSALEDYDGRPGGVSGNAEDDTFAGFSNYGAGVDIMAPGRAIRSTVPGGGLGKKSGTSMAAPHVAGAVALYLVHFPGAIPAGVRSGLLGSGDPAPCANSGDGTCADDPDGIQEPLLSLQCLENGGDCADGDLTEDGTVDSRDYLLGLRALQGLESLTDDQIVHGDVAPLANDSSDPDGVFNLGDLLVILRIVLNELLL
ncbi:MAG: S8 family serine peptidase [Gammaproteobacteria bacterium]|jgi:subtilisin family serine protease